MNRNPITAGIYIRLLLTMIFWGGTFVAGRIASHAMHPITAATGRFTLASLILLSFIYFKERQFPRLSLPEWGAMFLLGLTGVFTYNLFFFSGLQLVEAGRASMIIAANPVLTTILAVILFKERFNCSRSLGIVLSVTGALVVISHGKLLLLFQGSIGYGELCILGSVLSWSAYTLLGRKMLMSTISPLTAVTYSCCTGSLLLLATLFISGKSHELTTFSLQGSCALAYLAFFGTALGFIWFYEGVQQLGAGRASLFVNLVPVSGILSGILILGEKIDMSLAIGGGLVLFGLLLINRRYHQKPLHD